MRRHVDRPKAWVRRFYIRRTYSADWVALIMGPMPHLRMTTAYA